MANIVAGIFRGLPVGGSLSATAVNVVSGARSRWSVIFSGLWIALLVVAIPGAVSYVAMPSLGVLLIVAMSGTIKVRDALSIWRTQWHSALALVTTLIATITLPIQAAVGIGVVLSTLLTVNQSLSDISVVERVQRDDGLIEEREPSPRLAKDQVTVLDIYGSLFYGGAHTLERRLPNPQGAKNAVVVLRMRGHTNLGATLIDVLANYARRLEAENGRLYLSGVRPHARRQIVQSGKLPLSGPVRIFDVTPVVGQSTRQAYEDAQAWLVAQRGDPAPGQETPAAGGRP